MIDVRLERWGDAVGAAASAACGLHCAVGVVAALVVACEGQRAESCCHTPAFGLHDLVTFLTATFALVVLVPARRTLPLLLAGFGVTALVAGRFALPVSLVAPTATTGAALLVGAHVASIILRRRACCG